MKHVTSPRTALRLGASSAALLLGFAAAPALAQSAPQDPAAAKPAQTPTAPDNGGTQEIVVTGTLIRGANAESASPLVSVTSSDLAQRGINTVADYIQTLSSNNAGTLPPSWSSFGFSTGASAPSLRGFNDAFTLTIFDGLRTAPYPLADDGYRNFVDINTIPDAIVDRIDVLEDGASSTYGSDAVAGVVNVIIKKEIKGLHANLSAGISQRGDAAEQRADLTWGYGKLDEQGFNFYVNGEYQHNDPLYLHDRSYPNNTADLSRICGPSTVYPGTTTCGYNGVHNGIQYDGSYAGFQTTTVPFVRAYDATGTTATGKYQLLNPAAGCGNLPSYTLSASQLAPFPLATRNALPSTVCQQDLVNQYYQYNSDTQRIGGTAHLTVNVGGNAQAYAMFNWYRVKTQQQYTPDAFANTTAPVGTEDQYVVSPILLPTYVCSAGVGNLNPAATGCNAANGTLNPNNPFAANGQTARLFAYYDRPRTTYTDANTFRFSGGIKGSFGDNWNYNLEGTHSWVTLDVDQLNYLNAQRLLNAIATGSYNFVTPSANSQAARDYIAPPSHQHSISTLSEVQGTLSKDVFQLPGGAFTVLGGASWRRESIDNPSANPSNPANPLDRYYSINGFSTEGSRSVWSLQYEVNAPVFDKLLLRAEGRYDNYSLSYYKNGFSYFAPKFEAEFKPFSMLKIRGTYSKGFAVPSIAEASSTTTGYLTTTINCAVYTAFCASHASNPSYYSGLVGYGVTAIANPALKPQDSRSFNGGVVFTPTKWLTFTADYWNTKINNYIVSFNSAAVAQYYLNNGKVTIPGINAIAGEADPSNPNALPLLSTIQNPYANAASLLGSGVDLAATIQLPIGHNGLKWTSRGTASYLDKLQLTDASGATQVWAGSLSPCNISSCSGAPRWRATWANTLDFNHRASLTLTAYYTSGYSLIATDLGGTPGDCAGSIGAGVTSYYDGTALRCSANATFNLDMTAQVRVQDKFTLYVNVLNLIDNAPPFDPSAAYGIYNFNPAWGDRNFIGRYFRVGAKVDF